MNRFIHERKNFEILLRKTKKDFYYNKLNYCIGDSRQVFKIISEISEKNAKVSAINS